MSSTMADDVRRSGRANKGHHTKNADALDEPILNTKSKAKGKSEKKTSAAGGTETARSQSAQSVEKKEQKKEDKEDVIRCVCGDQRDIRGRQMILCDKCSVWQHNRCLNLPEGDYWENKEYYCEQCNPQDHVELLAAIGRGEKPWSRKKGQKPPKSRPSDVRADVREEKSQQPTPQPAQPPTPPSVPAPAPAPTKAETPASPATASTPASKDAPQESSNGKAEANPSKETPKSQPQSPTGEKRRHESASEKDTSKKRRKSSAPHTEKSPPQSEVASEIDALPSKQRRPLAEKLRDILVPLIDVAASDSRGYHIPDGETSRSLATTFALQIDQALLMRHGDTVNQESPFFKQHRSIMFNVKKNTILIDRLLTGGLTPEELAAMAPEEMASEEKQREYAAIREANEKQMVLTEETGPRLRKTHKGEEVVGEDYMPDDSTFRAPPPREREPDEQAQPQSPSRDGQMTVELPEDVGHRGPLAVDTSGAPVDGVRRPSAAFDINSVFEKVRSPQHDQQAFLPRRQSSIRAQERPQQGPGVDADIDRLLKDEDNDVEMSDYRSDPTIVWQGTISMQQMERFDTVARFVAGGDFGQVVPWDKLLASLLPIQGRIESGKGDEYIRGLGSTGSHDVAVLALSPVSSEGRAAFDHLYHYFQPRNRWGVVPVEGNDSVRDLYVIPVPPGGSNLPPFLDMLEHCTIETPRKEHMMLLALVAKLPEVKPQLQQAQQIEQYPGQTTPGPQPPHSIQAPNGPTNGPGPSPSPLTNPHGPQYSPVGTSFSPAQSFAANHHIQYAQPPPQQQPNNGHPYAPQQVPPQSHPQAINPRMTEILGPYINEPTTLQILQSGVGTTMTEDQMANLRYILDTVPEARASMKVLTEHLAARVVPEGKPVAVLPENGQA
ncbi:hypothetical protein K458DRAFT_114231 [Lentithecium fluviatile CBS 122367]|uniref:Transcription factor BYE1 n=1 Tax=Lentithecium fluviatile CBS 122367 TaxID=1168545 RepID=A0A6G1INT2_9PLEO|nr:hypothetical protein K458DRAFT_114231 [Lentithecium fluviatile CBS 122367]